MCILRRREIQSDHDFFFFFLFYLKSFHRLLHQYKYILKNGKNKIKKVQTSVIAAYMHASRLKRATTVQRAETTENCMSNARQVQGSRSQTEKLHEQREAGAGHRETARAAQDKGRAASRSQRNCTNSARQGQGSRSHTKKELHEQRKTRAGKQVTEKLHEQREASAGHRETARAVQSKCRASGQEKLHEQCKCRAAYHRERETARSARGKCSAASRSQRNCTSSEQVTEKLHEQSAGHRETARAECRSQRNCMSSATRVRAAGHTNTEAAPR